MTYVPQLKRFIMVVTSPTAATWPYQNLEYDTYFAEASSIEGPYALISYQKHFGPQAYFYTIPNFWMSKQVAEGPGSSSIALTPTTPDRSAGVCNHTL